MVEFIIVPTISHTLVIEEIVGGRTLETEFSVETFDTSSGT